MTTPPKVVSSRVLHAVEQRSSMTPVVAALVLLCQLLLQGCHHLVLLLEQAEYLLLATGLHHPVHVVHPVHSRSAGHSTHSLCLGHVVQTMNDA